MSFLEDYALSEKRRGVLYILGVGGMIIGATTIASYSKDNSNSIEEFVSNSPVENLSISDVKRYKKLESLENLGALYREKGSFDEKPSNYSGDIKRLIDSWKELPDEKRKLLMQQLLREESGNFMEKIRDIREDNLEDITFMLMKCC